jgi:hypothetical protein
MSEAEIRAQCVHPAVKATGWSAVDGSRILREYHISLAEARNKRKQLLVSNLCVSASLRELVYFLTPSCAMG